MKKIAIATIAVFALAGGAIAQNWGNFPVIGGASYSCGSTNAVSTCTVPAGPVDFTGIETIPIDTNIASGGNPQSAKVKATALGQGLVSVVTSPASATVAANTPIYVLNGAQGSAFTITMPAAPNGGDIQRVICQAATVGALSVAANTGQTLLNNPSTTCVAGVGYAWLYHATNTTWYRIQ